MKGGDFHANGWISYPWTIINFTDRNVVLDPGAPANDVLTSPIAARLQVQLPAGFEAEAETVWDPKDGRTVLESYEIGNRHDTDRFIWLRYRGVPGRVGEWDLIGKWSIIPRLSLVGRYNYSSRDDIEKERLLGIDYDTCCWALRFLARRFQNTPPGRCE